MITLIWNMLKSQDSISESPKSNCFKSKAYIYPITQASDIVCERYF